LTLLRPDAYCTFSFLPRDERRIVTWHAGLLSSLLLVLLVLIGESGEGRYVPATSR